MNAKKAKRIRKAAAAAGTTSQYEPTVVKTRLWERPTASGPSLEQCQIVQPAALKRGSPRQINKLLKRLERTVGLEKVYAGLLEEHMNEVQK
jgi:hypothetical protein